MIIAAFIPDGLSPKEIAAYLQEIAASLLEKPALMRIIDQALLLPPSSTKDQSLDCFTCSSCTLLQTLQEASLLQ
jgi:hypothetical protein